MKQYICIVTNEFSDIQNNFINSISFHTSYMDANDYGNERCNSLKGESDFFIYRNVSLSEEDFLNENQKNILPF